METNLYFVQIETFPRTQRGRTTGCFLLSGKKFDPSIISVISYFKVFSYFWSNIKATLFKLKFIQINLPDLSNRKFNHFNKFHIVLIHQGKVNIIISWYSRLDPDWDRGLVMAQGTEAGAGLLAVLAGVQGPGRHLRGQTGLPDPGTGGRHHLVTTDHLGAPGGWHHWGRLGGGARGCGGRGWGRQGGVQTHAPHTGAPGGRGNFPATVMELICVLTIW